MEADTALVWADSVIKLHTVSNVYMNLACIVDPRHSEGNDTIGLYEALDDGCLFELWVLVVDVLYR